MYFKNSPELNQTFVEYDQFSTDFFKVLNLRKLVWHRFEKDRTGHAREKGPPPPSFALEGVKKTINKSIKAGKEKLKEKMKEKIGVGTFPSEF